MTISGDFGSKFVIMCYYNHNNAMVNTRLSYVDMIFNGVLLDPNFVKRRIAIIDISVLLVKARYIKGNS